MQIDSYVRQERAFLNIQPDIDMFQKRANESIGFESFDDGYDLRKLTSR